MKLKYFNILFICLITLLLHSTSEAARKKRIKPPPRVIDIEHTNFAFAPYFTGGWIVGEGADFVESNHKALYGLGTVFVYQWKPKFGFYGNLEAVYGNVSDSSYTKYRVISYSGGLIFSLSPNKRSSLYFKGEFGKSKIRATKVGEDYGTHSFLELGIGNRIYSSPTITTWIEIYYKQIINKNKDLNYYHVTEEIDGQYIGLLFAASFGF